MISKKYIKLLEFKTIEDIFEYIVDSNINGAFSQMTQLIKKLSGYQFKDFLCWLEGKTKYYADIDIKDYVRARYEE